LQPGAPGAASAGWLLVLGLQALPYAAALGCALISGVERAAPRAQLGPRAAGRQEALDVAPPGG
jgi:hypothetical protein